MKLGELLTSTLPFSVSLVESTPEGLWLSVRDSLACFRLTLRRAHRRNGRRAT